MHYICIPAAAYDAGAGLELPAHFSPIYFPIGNAATGFFVIFAVIAGVVGVASALAGFHHVRAWSAESLPAAASAGFVAWTLTLLAMGYVFTYTARESVAADALASSTIQSSSVYAAVLVIDFLTRFPCLGNLVAGFRLAVKEIELHGRNARLVRSVANYTI